MPFVKSYFIKIYNQKDFKEQIMESFQYYSLISVDSSKNVLF